jgi:hypothetical protein
MTLDKMHPLPFERNLPGKQSGPFLHATISGGGTQLDLSPGQKGGDTRFEETLEVKNRPVLFPSDFEEKIAENPEGGKEVAVSDRHRKIRAAEEKNCPQGGMAQDEVGATVFHKPVDGQVRTEPLQRSHGGKGEKDIPDPSEKDDQNGTPTGKFRNPGQVLSGPIRALSRKESPMSTGYFFGSFFVRWFGQE